MRLGTRDCATVDYYPKIAVDPALDHVYVMGAAGEINAFHENGSFIGPVALTSVGHQDAQQLERRYASFAFT